MNKLEKLLVFILAATIVGLSAYAWVLGGKIRAVQDRVATLSVPSPTSTQNLEATLEFIVAPVGVIRQGSVPILVHPTANIEEEVIECKVFSDGLLYVPAWNQETAMQQPDYLLESGMTVRLLYFSSDERMTAVSWNDVDWPVVYIWTDSCRFK